MSTGESQFKITKDKKQKGIKIIIRINQQQKESSSKDWE